MTGIAYFAAGAVSAVLLVSFGIWLAFYVASKHLLLNLDRFEERARKTDPKTRIETEQGGGGPVRMRTPQRVEMDREKGLYDRVRDVIGG